MPRKYTPKQPTRFWCNTCDSAMIDSEQPDSGTFYVAFGHAFDERTEAYDGEYIGVMYAVCSTCEANHAT